ncbi:hypothetical protein [Parageobacillus thermoglucosidasius]|uniref:hypothetical protein n=1 Tax=Parageobacillus thermoglucosidasius TaxID=1426 RepID=UPI0030C6C7DE
MGKPEEARRIGRENARHSQNISARKDRRGKIQVYAPMERLTNAAGREGKRSM